MTTDEIAKSLIEEIERLNIVISSLKVHANHLITIYEQRIADLEKENKQLKEKFEKAIYYFQSVPDDETVSAYHIIKILSDSEGKE